MRIIYELGDKVNVFEEDSTESSLEIYGTGTVIGRRERIDNDFIECEIEFEPLPNGRYAPSTQWIRADHLGPQFIGNEDEHRLKEKIEMDTKLFEAKSRSQTRTGW